MYYIISNHQCICVENCFYEGLCVSLYPVVAGLSQEGLAHQCVIFYV